MVEYDTRLMSCDTVVNTMKREKAQEEHDAKRVRSFSMR